MQEEPLLPERVFGLSVADGRRSVRPGAIVRFRFRARNASELATPAARLTFRLPAGWSVLDPLAIDVPPIRPGGEHDVWLTARPDIADDSTMLSRIQAALRIDEVVLGSNVVTVRVIGSPRFNTPASAIRVEAAEDDALRVRVELRNEGDAAAHHLRAIVPAPPGFHADPLATIADCEELAPDAAFTFEYLMRPFAPASANVAIDDAYVAFDGGRVALMTGASFLLAPTLAPPTVEMKRNANKLDCVVRVNNTGWVPAHDVRCSLELPAGWRILRGTLLADNAPAMLRRDPGAENGVTITLPFVPARGFVDLSVIASATRRADGELIVNCGDHVTAAPIPEPVQRALRLDGRPESSFAEPGSTVAIAVDVMNSGETPERVSVFLDESQVWTEALRPGSAAAFVCHTTMPVIADGEAVPVQLVARGEDGATLATASLELRALDRPWIAVEEVALEGGAARVVLRNVGATTARDLRLEGENEVRIPSLAPGESQTLAVDPAVVKRASVVGHDGVAVPFGWEVQADTVSVQAVLSAPESVRVGQRFEIQLRAIAAAEVESFRLRPRPQSGAIYVAGSTQVNGYAIVDGVDGPPLLLGEGLALYDIPSGTEAEIVWSLLPRTPGELVIAVELEANGAAIAVAPVSVRVIDAVPFGVRPTALPFHIDAATVTTPAPAPPTVSGPTATADAFLTFEHAERRLAPPNAVREAPTPSLEDPPQLSLTLALDDNRWAQIRRVLRGARGPGLIAHVPAIAVLFPTFVASGDDELIRTFAVAAEAVRTAYQKLFVKVRIPGYGITAADLDDAALRRDLVAFIDAALYVTPSTLLPRSTSGLTLALDEPRLRRARGLLVEGPLGMAALNAIALLLPTDGSSDREQLLGSYVVALTSELALHAGASGETAATLGADASSELDLTRDAIVGLLDSDPTLAER